MSKRPLADGVIELAGGFAGRLVGPSRPRVEEIVGRLREPLRIAVVGRVKAGKSTLVNALLGQRSAPTDVSECTRIVTWYHYGPLERLEIRKRDGSAVVRPLAPGSRLPAELGVAESAIASLHVTLPNDLLRTMILIDTPGLQALSDGVSARTELFLGGTAADGLQGEADCVALVLNGAMRADELAALQAFRGPGGSRGGSALNAVGVLSKADKIGGGEDAWRQAGKVAFRASQAHRGELATVLPVVGLVAETAECGGLDEREAARLEALAGIDPARRERLTWSVEGFVAQEPGLPVGADDRTRLLERLDLWGVERALDLIDGGAHGAEALTEGLRAASGIAAVRRALVEGFERRGDALRAKAALDALRDLSHASPTDPDAATMRQLGDEVEALVDKPSMQPLQELTALHSLYSGAVQLPSPFSAELETVVLGGSLQERLGAPDADPSDILRLAGEASRRWRTFMNGMSNPRQRAIARVVLGSLSAIAQEARASVEAER